MARRNLGLSSGAQALKGSDGLRQERLALRLYEAQRGALVAYAARMLGDVSRAEDIVQDAWLLFDRLPDKQAIAEPLAYLRRMVGNLSINALRHVALRQRLTDRDMEAATRMVADPFPICPPEASHGSFIGEIVQPISSS
ncbi:sigma factor [Novosphingobium terrae]|uniref:sigma factor n=1 Tax=Novosphingobium terrae TaxID=2726189 RepID=UPI0019821D4B|nr:sigma factor [Novosphingobium terrae]